MKILKEGRAHKRYAWFATCKCCNSELRFIEGDPYAGDTCYNCDAYQYYVRYICPVCRAHNIAYTASSFGVKANAEYKEIMLTGEDREEIENWEERNAVLKDIEDAKFLSNRCRV